MSENVFVVPVDYDKTLEEMMRDAKIAKADPEISSKLFPADQHGKQSVRIKLLAELTEETFRIFRRATIYEVLALIAKHPKLPGKFDILAPGSVKSDIYLSPSGGGGTYHIPSFGRKNNKKTLKMRWAGVAEDPKKERVALVQI